MGTATIGYSCKVWVVFVDPKHLLAYILDSFMGAQSLLPENILSPCRRLGGRGGREMLTQT